MSFNFLSRENALQRENNNIEKQHKQIRAKQKWKLKP